MRVGRLLIALLLVSLIASCGTGFVAIAVSSVTEPQSMSSDNAAFAFVIVSVIGFLIAVPAVLLVGLPLALVMDRMAVPALLRDAVFLLCGLLGAFLFARAYPDMPSAFLNGAAVSFAIALLWIAGVRWAARRPLGSAT